MKNIDYKTVNKYILGAFLFILSWFFSLSMADTISDQFVCTWWVCSMKPAALKWLCTNAIIWTSSYFMECTPAVNYNPSSSVLAANSVTTFNSIGDFFDCSSGTCILKKESLNWICAVNYTLYFDAWWNVTCIPLTSLTSAPCSASTKNVNWHTYNLPLFNAQVQSSSIVNANNWSFTYYQNFWCDNWVVSTIWSESIDGTKTTCNSWYSVSADWLSCIPLNCSFNWNVVNNWSSVTAYSLLNATYPTLCSSQSRVCTNWTLWWTYTYDSCTQSYVYSWTTWAYWSCSATCWWGTQTRTVVCQRNDWQIVADTNCTWAKPATSQSCNTQVCVINYYTNTDYTLACPASVAIWYRCWWWVVAQVWSTSQTKVIAFPSDEPDQKWALVENYATNITSISDWLFNTNLLMSKSTTNFPAAKRCYDKTWNWQSDWFLPAWDQLDALHTNSSTIWWFTSSNYYSSSLYSWYSWWSVYIWDWYWVPHIYSPNTDLRHVRCVRNY